MSSIRGILASAQASLTEDSKRVKLQFIWIYWIIMLVAVGMTVVNFFTAKYLLMIATLVFALLCAVNIVISKRDEKNLRISSFLFSVEFLILMVFFIVSGIPDGFSVIWICMIPASGLLLFQRKRGTILCAVMFAIIVFFFQVPLGESLLQYPYTETFKLRFPMLYIAFFAVSFFLETVRALTHDKLLQTQKQYEYLYSHDALTGVYNRYGFNGHLDEMLNKPLQKRIALMILDIDHFKKVNDEFGHIQGDIVLKKIADFLTEQTCGQAYVCRWGGEEFAALYYDDEDVVAKAQGIINRLEKLPIDLDDGTIHITASIGLVIAPVNKKIKPASFVLQTDRCLYKAKENGRNQVVYEMFAE